MTLRRIDSNDALRRFWLAERRLLQAREERDRLGTVWTLLRRARTAVGTRVVWPRYT